jgi:hypothetical protein
MALSADRNTPYRLGDQVSHPIAAATVVYAGSIVVLNATDYAEPGTTDTGLRAEGRAEARVDNTGGADGDLQVPCMKGVFQFANSVGDAVDRSHIGGVAYIEDDETVSATDGTGSQSAAGTIVDLDAAGVWVHIS